MFNTLLSLFRRWNCMLRFPGRNRMVCLLAAALYTLTAAAADFNILDFGARPDTTVLSTQALQKAVDACAAAGASALSLG